ncbi:MAG: hypothetical protein Q8O83_01955 [bacterium]|nr:hypothetical protein [bacterium]
MLTDQDIKKLIEVFATREEVATKKDLEEVRKDFSDLQSSVDSYAKKADTYFQEMLVLAHRVDRIEKWMKQIADKVGIKLEY